MGRGKQIMFYVVNNAKYSVVLLSHFTINGNYVYNIYVTCLDHGICVKYRFE